MAQGSSGSPLCKEHPWYGDGAQALGTHRHFGTVLMGVREVVASGLKSCSCSTDVLTALCCFPYRGNCW
jgi:hypothetical protein